MIDTSLKFSIFLAISGDPDIGDHLSVTIRGNDN